MTPLSRMVQSVYPFHAYVYEKPSAVGLGKEWVKEMDSVPAPERLNILLSVSLGCSEVHRASSPCSVEGPLLGTRHQRPHPMKPHYTNAHADQACHINGCPEMH